MYFKFQVNLAEVSLTKVSLPNTRNTYSNVILKQLMNILLDYVH